MSGDAFGIHIGLAIPSCANRHPGPSQLAGAPHTGPAGRTYGLVNLPNETCASSSALRAVAARPESEEDRTRRADRKNDVNDPKRSAPGSWQRIGGGSPPRGRFSQPPRPRVMHEVLLARAAVKRSQGRPRAKY